jgi:beta-galactosidase
VHNWSWTEAQVRVPLSLRDVLDGAGLSTGSMLALGAWDVRVLVRPIP